MKTTVKKILLTLSAVLLFAVVLCFNASALEPTGKCGDNVTWSFDSETGTLTISGTGDMADYYDNSPFKYKYEIDNVIIENGVTSIGKSVFSDCINIESVTIGKDVTTIPQYLFCPYSSNISYAPKITTVTFEENSSCITMGNYALCIFISPRGTCNQDQGLHEPGSFLPELIR